MAKQNINVGTAANDKKGDSLRAAFQKVNANFTELYTALGLNDPTLNLGAFEFTGSVISTTDSTPIVIDQAVSVTSDLTVGGDIVPNIANGGDLGSLARPWKSMYVSNQTIYLGGTPLSLDPNTNELKINNVPVSQTINYEDIPNVPTDVSDLTDTEGLLGGGAGGGLSITDFGLGFTDTLDAGKITTSKLYNENPNQGLNNQYTLEVTDGGVVALPDGSIINGATLKTIAGNYAGITAGPNGADEDSWVWVDNNGATIATKYSTDNHTWTFNNNGGLTFPQGTFLGYSDPGGFIIDGAVDKDIAIYTYSGADAYGWTFGTDGSLKLPGTLDYRIGESFGGGSLAITSEGTVSIFTNSIEGFKLWSFDTDGNLQLPVGGEIRFSYGYIDQDDDVQGNALRISGGNSVVINTDEDGKSWEFDNRGVLRLPADGDIINSSGQSVLGGGSYTPDDTDNWEDPAVNTIQAALDELAARMTAFENFEIDGGNAYTPAAGELLIDGNGA